METRKVIIIGSQAVTASTILRSLRIDVPTITCAVQELGQATKQTTDSIDEIRVTLNRIYGSKETLQQWDELSNDIGVELIRHELVNKPQRTGKHGFNSARNRVISKAGYC